MAYQFLLGAQHVPLRGSLTFGLTQGSTNQAQVVEAVENKLTVVPYYWNPDSLAYEVARQVSTSGSASTGGGPGSTTIDANLTSAGSSRQVGTVNQGTAGSSSGPWWTRETNPTTAVNVANPTTSVNVANPTTSISLSSQHTVTVGNPTTSVTITNPATSVTLTAGSSANVIGGVVLSSGSTAVTAGSVALLNGSTGNSIGSVALLSGSSANVLGNVAQGVGGSSANNWISDGFAFSSANTSRTSVGTTVDVSVVAANANRKGLIIANLSTSQVVALGMSTAAVTTGLANVSMYLQPASQLVWGYGGGGFPNFTGNIRGINITSTTVGGGVAVTQFTNT